MDKIIVKKNGKAIYINVYNTPDTTNQTEIAVGQIIDTVVNKAVYWSDTNLYHYCFDYKLPCGVWCENIRLTDSLKKIECTVCL